MRVYVCQCVYERMLMKDRREHNKILEDQSYRPLCTAQCGCRELDLTPPGEQPVLSITASFL